MAVMRILAPGLFTTVQDLGRPGYAALGISACGAADPVALRIGNRLVGNAVTAPALEMTLVGATVEFTAPAWIALTGAACAAGRGSSRSGSESPLPMWTAVPVAAGEVVRCGAARDGARTYLCIGGGLDVPLVLGSASTHTRSRLGGVHGRALRAGDELPLAVANYWLPKPGSAGPAVLERLYPGGPLRSIRITSGPQQDWFSEAALAALGTSQYSVSARSDRMGVRLSGPPIPAPRAERGGLDAEAAAPAAPPGELLSQGVPLGAVQIPADGQPILLGVDQQTTGGYPVIAGVIAADVARLGQLRPADRVQLTWVGLAQADVLRRELEELVNSPALVVA